MKNFRIMLSVTLALIIISMSVVPSFAQSTSGFDSALKQEDVISSEDYEVISEELNEGPYNNDEKIFCKATIEEDFDDDSLLVVMKNEASIDIENNSVPQFSEIKAKSVNELTSHKTKEIRNEFESKKAEFTSALKDIALSSNKVARNSLSKSTGGKLTATENAMIEKKSTDLSIEEIEEEYSDFHKIIYIELNTKDKQNVIDTIKELEKNEDVLAVEPNYYWHPSAITTNDTYFGDQWALSNISAPSAWEITKGSSSVKVGVIDDGIDASHPDLSDNYDYTLSKSFTDAPANQSVKGHGTKVAGVIGAVGNNQKGISGVCWNVSLVSLQTCTTNYEYDTMSIVNAVNYADEKNIDILNISLTTPSAVSSYISAINSFDGIVVCSAGNDMKNIDDEQTNKVYYPSLWGSNKIISVASIKSNNTLADDSNYGGTSVDLAAPGFGVYSTVDEDNKKYKEVYGTSFAAPYVAGAAALIKSKYPDISYLGIRKAILSGVDKKSTLSGKVSTGGKLNAYKALNKVGTINYTIEYDANGGTGTMADTPITYGFYTDLRDVAYTKPQHDFVGWEVYRASDNKFYYEKNGTKRWYAEGAQPAGYKKVVYDNQTPIGHLSTTNGEVITMIAQWKLHTYTIRLLWYSTVDGVVQDIEADYNTNVTLPECTYIRTGYTFSGWRVYKYTTDSEVVWLYSNGTSKNWYVENTQPIGYNIVELNDNSQFCNTDEITKGSVLYFDAQWDPLSYVLSYDSNGGVGVMENTIGYHDVSVQLRTNTFTKQHYKFVGWRIVDTDGYWSTVDGEWDDTISEDSDNVKLYNDGDSVTYPVDYEGVGLIAKAKWLLLGDVNFDGQITIIDATKIQRYFARMETFTEEQISVGDFNEDGTFSILDATAIQEYVSSGSN